MSMNYVLKGIRNRFLKKVSVKSVDHPGTESSRLINKILRVRGMKEVNYLEIGVEHGATFQNIEAKLKIGVDPEPKMKAFSKKKVKLFVETSDAFFSRNSTLFDVVFLDGLHIFEQTWLDLRNAMKVCNQDVTL
jgi:hypothetical protein